MTVVRKFVKPAHVGACIPDPAHRLDLPQEGAEVVWDHYWIGRMKSGDVIVSEIKTPLPVAPTPGAPTGAVPVKALPSTTV